MVLPSGVRLDFQQHVVKIIEVKDYYKKEIEKAKKMEKIAADPAVLKPMEGKIAADPTVHVTVHRLGRFFFPVLATLLFSAAICAHLFYFSRSNLLHAVPTSELILTPELATSSPVHEELFTTLFKDQSMIGTPKQPVVTAIDFKGTQVQASLLKAGGALAVRISDTPSAVAVESPASAPSPSPSPLASRPWLVEMQRAARPVNGTLPIRDGTRGRWAYGVQDARAGTVLLANKPFGASKSYFEGAAVLLLKVCGCHPSIFGVVLSAPTTQRMGDHFCPTAKRNYPAFLNSTVRMGGPVGPHWTLLHSLPDVHAEQLSDGLFMGGALTEVQRDVAAGRASTSDVLFYSGYAAWPIDRLEAEVRAGQWNVAKASPSLLLEAAKTGDAHTLISLAMAK